MVRSLILDCKRLILYQGVNGVLDAGAESDAVILVEDCELLNHGILAELRFTAFAR